MDKIKQTLGQLRQKPKQLRVPGTSLCSSMFFPMFPALLPADGDRWHTAMVGTSNCASSPPPRGQAECAWGWRQSRHGRCNEIRVMHLRSHPRTDIPCGSHSLHAGLGWVIHSVTVPVRRKASARAQGAQRAEIRACFTHLFTKQKR